MSDLVSIKACFDKTLPDSGLYKVTVDIIDVVNIDFDVLVFRSEDDTFSHVASVFDLETYPVTKDPTCSFYRGRGAEVTFDNLRDATSFETVTQNRLKFLAVSWNTILCDFQGKDTVTLDSDISN